MNRRQRHDAVLLLFQNRPDLALTLTKYQIPVPLPAPDQVRAVLVDIPEFPDVDYRPDLVVHVLHENGELIGAIVLVLEPPRDLDRTVWPAYVANLQAGLNRPVSLVVLALDEATARWAEQPIKIGRGFSEH